MAIAVTANISIDGGKPLTDYLSISIRQELHAHHSFQVSVPYELLEQDRTDGFFHQAHQNYCGKFITIILTPVRETNFPALKFKGVVTHIALSNSGDFAHSFVLSGFSPSYLLEDGSQRRTFLKKGLKDIFSEVLAGEADKPYPSNLLTHGPLNPQHRDPIKYVVQYGESNYAFLRRLADAYGEWFYYDGQTIRLGKPDDGTPLPFAVTSMAGFSLALELVPASFTLNRYDYLAHQPYQGTSGSQSLGRLNPFAAFALRESEALFSQPARLTANRHVRSQDQLDKTIKDWKANQVSSMVTFQGTGENPGFSVGKLIIAQGGTGKKMHDYGVYRLSEVTHLVQADQYQNSFVAIPDAAEHPASNIHAQSPLGVPELAEVIDVADPQNLGRVRVRYYWPVARPQLAETGWLRVTTPYSGDGKGQLFTPEVGSQVLVGYEQGLAEFPLVLGNLFHPKNKQKAKYSTPQNHLKGLQTAGGNKVVMNDTKDKQTIVLSNANKKTTAITVSFENDGKVHIQSAGPVVVNGSNIALEAGAPSEAGGPYTGAISLKGKTISLEAEEDITAVSHQENVTLHAAKKLAAKATGNLTLEGKTSVLTGSDKITLTSSQAIDVQAPSLKLNA